MQTKKYRFEITKTYREKIAMKEQEITLAQNEGWTMNIRFKFFLYL